SPVSALLLGADRTPPGPLGSFRAASLFQSKPRPNPRRKAGVASSKRVGGIGPPDDKRRLSLAGPQVIHCLCSPGGRVGCSTHRLPVGSGDTLAPARGCFSLARGPKQTPARRLGKEPGCAAQRVCVGAGPRSGSTIVPESAVALKSFRLVPLHHQRAV